MSKPKTAKPSGDQKQLNLFELADPAPRPERRGRSPASRAAPLDDAQLKLRSMEDLEAVIAELEAEIRPIQIRIAKLRRTLAAKKAGRASGPARLKGDAKAVQARWRELGGGRGAISVLREEFGMSERTVHRRLGSRHERRP